MKDERRKFDARGPLALDPRAFGELFERVEPSQGQGGDVGHVSVFGPLMHRGEALFFDTYDSILARFKAVTEQGAKTVVLTIDSPGGMVSGLFDTCEQLRKAAAESGVHLIAWVDGQATSAAYALACAADEVYVSSTAVIGSVGVIDTMVDETAAMASAGVSVELVTSGKRKADGNPMTKIGERALEAAQGRVDKLAQNFFDYVAERRGLQATDIADFEAGVFVGDQALGLGLVDGIETYTNLLSLAAGVDESEGDPMSEFDDGIAKLRKAAEGDDEEAKLARKMLTAMEEDTEEESKAEGEEEEEKEEAKAEDYEEKDESATKALAAHVKDLGARLAAQEKVLADREMAELMASYPHVDESIKAFAKKTLGVKEARALFAKIPKPTLPNKAAATTPKVTQGDSQVDGSAPRQSPEAKRQLDVAMGLASQQYGVKNEANRLVLGAPIETK